MVEAQGPQQDAGRTRTKVSPFKSCSSPSNRYPQATVRKAHCLAARGSQDDRKMSPPPAGPQVERTQRRRQRIPASPSANRKVVFKKGGQHRHHSQFLSRNSPHR